MGDEHGEHATKDRSAGQVAANAANLEPAPVEGDAHRSSGPCCDEWARDSEGMQRRLVVALAEGLGCEVDVGWRRCSPQTDVALGSRGGIVDRADAGGSGRSQVHALGRLQQVYRARARGGSVLDPQ